jgi:NAD(P)-dependent dehydrogenase (short-subunit alcohol dehydrogenase family)
MAQSVEQQKTKPGLQHKMKLQPRTDNPAYKSSGKLKGKVAIITGGDSGIGQAVAVAYAKEGADVAIGYLKEDKDAEITKQMVAGYGRRCIAIKGDVGDEKFCQKLLGTVLKKVGRIDILVNNAGEQTVQKSITDITKKQLERTFSSNIFSMFFLSKAVLKFMKKGSTIINTTSVTAYRGSPELLDYSSTKGAIVSFTRSLSESLAPRGIRVNMVAPGPIWTPLIVSTFPAAKIREFGMNVPLGRAGQPDEVAPAFVFLASEDSSFITGQCIHVNGGELING